MLRAMFVAGPFGCFLITAMTGAIITLNAHRFHVRFVNFVLTIALLAWMAYLTNAVPSKYIAFSN